MMALFLLSLLPHLITVALVALVVILMVVAERTFDTAATLARAEGYSKAVSETSDQAQSYVFMAIILSPFAVLAVLLSLSAITWNI